ncbi:MAG: PorV/PorQ family protein [Candidatus Zixiibacteriota bacterium]
MLRRAAWLIGVLLVLCAGTATAVDDTQPGFAFLTIGGGARAVGLAETMVGDDQDAFVTEYNPAALVDVSRVAVSFAHNVFYLDTRGEYVAAVVPLHAWSIGARVGYVGTSDIPMRTGPSDEPLALFDGSNAVVQGALARRVDDRLAVGLSAAYVAENINLETAQGFTLGVGLRYRPVRNVTMGCAFLNVGPATKFKDREFRMPSIFRFGGRWMIGRASARAELVTADRDNVKWNLGSEYAVDPRVSLRGGVRLGYDTQVFTAGLGMQTPDGRFGVDYAYSPYSDDLGATHRFGLTVRP